jgi:Flp pilus assembly protein CpaB
MAGLSDTLSRVRRSYLRHRRLLTAGFAAVAVLCLGHVVAPGSPARTAEVVAAHDLEAGSVLGSGDLRVVRTDPQAVPAHAATETTALTGRTVAAPMRAGEPFTDQRLVGQSLVRGYPGDVVAAPVRVQDAAAVSLLRVGDRIDVYSASGDPSRPADRIVAGAYVVTMPAPDPRADARGGALVVLAVTEPEAARLAQAGAVASLSVSLLG